MQINENVRSLVRKRCIVPKMYKRLASHDEINMNYSYNVENNKATYLRRKIERGKNFRLISFV